MEGLPPSNYFHIITYKYDAAGNILSKSTYNVTSGAVVTPTEIRLYKYAADGWKDKLVSYDGVNIIYDSMGNPTRYRGHSLKWDRVRLLTQWDDTVMEYNANGIRTRKGDTYYELDGSNIISETTNGNTIRYYYGTNGITAFRYNGKYYYYEKNLQGDITGIYDENGNNVAEYAYDAWGNCTILADFVGIAEINPFRYRGYYYDSETGLYYVSSRYYDPEIGRFINADDISYLGANGDFTSLNLFAYCGNNSVMREDSEGNFWLVSVAIGLATQYIGDVIGNLIDGKTGADVFKPTSSVGEYIAAGVTALIPGTGLGGALVRNIVAEGITVIEDAILGNEVNVVDSIISVGLGTVLDAGFEKVSDKAADFISSKMPQNYSSYAHAARQSNQNLTREQIYRSMQRSIRFNRVASKSVSIGFDIVRSTLPY